MGKKNDPKAAAFAAFMKAHGIIRRSGRCSVCYKITSIPMDNHFRAGGGCS